MYRFKNLNSSQMAAVEVDALMRVQTQHNALVEAERAAGLKRAEAQEEGDRVMAKIIAENEAKAAAEEKARREESRRQLEAELREKYMRLPGSTSLGWLNDKDRIISDHFAELMKNQQLFEEAERAKYLPM
jgi:hypothetical protein